MQPPVPFAPKVFVLVSRARDSSLPLPSINFFSFCLGMCNASSTSSDVCSHASNFFPCVVAKEPKQKPQFHFTPSPLLRRSHVPLIDLVQTTGHIKKEQRCHLLGVIHRTLFKHLFLPRTILLFFHRGGIQSASRRFWKRQEKGLFFFSWPSPLIISVGLAKIARGHGRPLGLKLPIAVNQFRAVRGSRTHVALFGN